MAMTPPLDPQVRELIAFVDELRVKAEADHDDRDNLWSVRDRGRAEWNVLTKVRSRLDALLTRPVPQPDVAALVAVNEELRAECARQYALLNTPEIHDFSRAVVLEAAHQRERWPDDHDATKGHEDWFWLVGYLAGKALRPDQTVEKRLHRIITIAAAAANWHAHTRHEDGLPDLLAASRPDGEARHQQDRDRIGQAISFLNDVATLGDEDEDILDPALLGSYRDEAAVHRDVLMNMTLGWEKPATPPVDGQARPQPVNRDDAGEHVCCHGTALDVHCCNCHSGFIFDRDHQCDVVLPQALLDQLMNALESDASLNDRRLAFEAVQQYFDPDTAPPRGEARHEDQGNV